ncbi:MAG: dTMP kinase [Betaproteobacteria bacterium]|jgi:dTMP kinase|nr:dTMP kinase [Betaproteobacteria bacterium]MBU6512091.1 dTMP kinase [Betaproteobacteria bacterium]MDE1955444.1 dTMP kinase [Betaproteobacteria bacterium]MDE2153441.1 dTMP kinase [Betaproteobacteria bacterium]MDE2478098.1 dTMP kinase [Betaproteobacteria bacterium]
MRAGANSPVEAPALKTPQSRGWFITLEGIDGAGKSSQFSAVVETLRGLGRAVVATREPGGTPLGERLRELLLNEPMSTSAEALLVFAARQEHVLHVIEPALLRGQDVVCDRFTDATLAYQGAGKGIPRDRLEALAQWVHPGLEPDLTLLLDLPAEVAAQRMQAQGRAADRFEREPQEFFARVRRQYLELAREQPRRWRVIDANRSLEEVREDVLQSLKSLLEA